MIECFNDKVCDAHLCKGYYSTVCQYVMPSPPVQRLLQYSMPVCIIHTYTVTGSSQTDFFAINQVQNLYIY